MKKLFLLLIVVVAVLAAYLLAWPVEVDPAAWNPPEPPGLEGPYAPNAYLADVERLGEGVGPAPEDIAVDDEGRIYGGMKDGRIVRWTPDASEHEVFADTGGRPLGLAFDSAGYLIVADAAKGLLSVSPEGEITVLSTGHGGKPFKFTDDVDIAEDGTIYFSDASWKYGAEEVTADLVEHRPNGRLLAYDPDTKSTELVLENLYFANGVAVSHDQQSVLVAETGAYRVKRYWRGGPKAGGAEVFIDNLPGFPDGVSAGSGGVYWLALASTRKPSLDALMPRPFLRKIIMRLPAALRPAAAHYSFVLGLNGEGEVVHNLQHPDGAYAPITSVQENDGTLYFGSIEEHAFARIAAPDANTS